MKTTNKLAVLAMCLIAAAALVTTSCDGFGKDDFYGTWNSGDYVIDTGSHKGDTVNVTFYFSGTSENLTNGGSAMFYEEFTRTGKDSGKVEAHNFWWGNYNLTGNSSVTSGKLTLRYFYGYDLTQTNAKSVNDLIALVEAEDPYTQFESLCPAGTDYYDVDTEHSSDVELFTYELGNQDFLKGYQSMTDTSVSQWSEFDGKETDKTQTNCNRTGKKATPIDGTSWGAKDSSRTFTLVADNGSDVTVKDTTITKKTSSSIISTMPVSEEVNPAALEK